MKEPDKQTARRTGAESATGPACGRGRGRNTPDESLRHAPAAAELCGAGNEAGAPSRRPECPSAATGRRGEEAAAEWLRREGYEICARNWRSGRYELDIVARKSACLHFVEVKTRSADGLTPPEQALTPAKCRALVHAAARYMTRYGSTEEPRFDLAAVDMSPDGGAVVRFIPDAVESHW